MKITVLGAKKDNKYYLLSGVLDNEHLIPLTKNTEYTEDIRVFPYDQFTKEAADGYENAYLTIDTDLTDEEIKNLHSWSVKYYMINKTFTFIDEQTKPATYTWALYNSDNNWDKGFLEEFVTWFMLYGYKHNSVEYNNTMRLLDLYIQDIIKNPDSEENMPSIDLSINKTTTPLIEGINELKNTYAGKVYFTLGQYGIVDLEDIDLDSIEVDTLYNLFITGSAYISDKDTERIFKTKGFAEYYISHASDTQLMEYLSYPNILNIIINAVTDKNALFSKYIKYTIDDLNSSAETYNDFISSFKDTNYQGYDPKIYDEYFDYFYDVDCSEYDEDYDYEDDDDDLLVDERLEDLKSIIRLWVVYDVDYKQTLLAKIPKKFIKQAVEELAYREKLADTWENIVSTTLGKGSHYDSFEQADNARIDN